MRISFSIPYSSELSKNKRYKYRSSKKKNELHTNIQNAIGLMFKSHLKSPPKKMKSYVHITVFRPNMRGDASNFINPICDAIKECLDYDDNWFSGSWDWVIDKKNPRIEITFSQ